MKEELSIQHLALIATALNAMHGALPDDAPEEIKSDVVNAFEIIKSMAHDIMQLHQEFESIVEEQLFDVDNFGDKIIADPAIE
mgnify:CR=1 FL=1